MAIELIQSFLQQATASGSKSTVLTDLRWFAAIMASAFLIAFKIELPTWAQIIISVILVLTAILYLGAYVFFARTSPDSLRSEKFTLSKMAIERSVTGDNLTGFVDPAINKNALNMPDTTPKKI